MYTDCPPKIIIGLSALITFEIVNYNLNMPHDYKNITNYLYFGESPIRFGSVVTKKCGF